MVAVINVFYRGNEDEKNFIEVLVKHDFVHYVDSVRLNDANWIAQNCKKGLYRCSEINWKYDEKCFDPNLIDGDDKKHDFEELKPEELDTSSPGVYVLIVDCLEENPNFYKDVIEFLQECFDGDVSKDLNRWYKLLDMFPAQKEKLPERKIEKRSRDDTDTTDFVSTDYTFDYKKLEDLDCIFYQLTKPNTDRPYVVLVKNFSKHSHKRLFTSMRLFDSWGASKYDMAFLQQLWTYLGGCYEPDFDEMLKEHVEAVLYGEEEPKVWRSDLDSVVTDYIRKVGSSSKPSSIL